MVNRKKSFRSDISGISYSVSSVVITASTVVLVLVASSFAYQILEQQRGTSEFNLAKKSLLTLDDSVQDIAWSIKGSRQTRFSIDYGQLDLYPDNLDLGMNISVNVAVSGNPSFSRNYLTGYVEYSIPEQSVSFARREPQYVLGDEDTIVNDGTASLGRILVYPNSGWVNALLSYRVRVMETSTITVGDDVTSYVNVWVVKLKASEFSVNIDNFDMTTSAYNMYTESIGPIPISGDRNFVIGVQYQDEPYSQKTISLNESSDYVVFNFIISEVELVP